MNPRCAPFPMTKSPRPANLKAMPETSQEKMKMNPRCAPFPLTDPLPSCYRPPSPSPMSVTPPGSPQDEFIFPEKAYSSKEVKFRNQEQMDVQQNVKEAVGKPSVDILGNMLAELREGTMAVDM